MPSPLELPAARNPLDAEQAVSAIARYYDLDFGHLQEDIELYANLARGLATGASILELGAGTGRVAAALADRGADVTAVENNDAMIAAGAERYQAAGVNVVQQDMRQLDVGAERFDLVICALSSFCHLETRADQLATLRGVRRALAADGQLLLDLPALSAEDWEEGPRPLLHEWTRRHPVSDREVTKLASLDAHPASQIQDVTYIYDEARADGSVERTIARFPLRHVFRFEVVGLLEAAGMHVTNCYGSYELAAVEAGERLIVLAQTWALASEGRD